MMKKTIIKWQQTSGLNESFLMHGTCEKNDRWKSAYCMAILMKDIHLTNDADN